MVSQLCQHIHTDGVPVLLQIIEHCFARMKNFSLFVIWDADAQGVENEFIKASVLLFRQISQALPQLVFYISEFLT